MALKALVEGSVHGAHAPRADPLHQAESIHHQFTDHSYFRFAAIGPLPAAPEHTERSFGPRLVWPNGRSARVAAESALRPGFHTLWTKGDVRLTRWEPVENAPEGRSLAFLDEDDALEPAEPGPSRRYGDGGPGPRPYMARRLMGLAIAVLIIVLLVLGIRGCLNARKERGFENYQRDLIAIADQANQLSNDFFKRLQEPSDGEPLDFQAQLNSDASTAEGLLERVQTLDTPDELASEQQDLELAFSLRRDGIDGIADQIQNALGNQPGEAQEAIADFMRYFLASDVLYGRARTGIDNELKAQEITTEERLPDQAFLPTDEWLDPDFVGSNLSGAAAGTGSCPRGETCGLALTQTDIAGVALIADAENTVSGGGPYEITVSAENQGTIAAKDVPISFTLSGGAREIEGEGTIGNIAPGLTETGTIRIQPNPESGASLNLEVSAGPIGGEQLTDNNTFNYTVTFE